MAKQQYEWEKDLIQIKRKSLHDQIMERIENNETGERKPKRNFKRFYIVGLATASVAAAIFLSLYRFDKPILSMNEGTQTIVNQSEPPIEKYEPYSSGAYGQIYNNLVDLVLDSEIAIEGQVIETTYFEFSQGEGMRPMIYTKSKVLVAKSFTNQVKKGSLVTFIEMGGIGTKKMIGSISLNTPNGVPKEHENDKIEIIYLGEPAMKQSDTVFLFASLSTSSFPGVNEPNYFITGGFMGKFNIKNGVAERYVPYNKPERMTYFDTMKMNISDLERKTKKLEDEKSRGEL